MKVTFTGLTLPATSAAVVITNKQKALGKIAADLDKKAGGVISKAIARETFEGKSGELLSLAAPAGCDQDIIIVLGLGDAKEATDITLQQAGGKIVAQCKAAKLADITVICDQLVNAKQAAQLAYGARLRHYNFDKYKTKEQEDDKKIDIAAFTVCVDAHDKADKEYATLASIAEGVFLARNLVTEPPNVLYPESYAHRCQELEELGVEVKVLGEKEMTQLGMGALLGVGQGSIRESKLVVMRWNGDPKGKEEQPIAFVGKGVTFDTGGISLKPAAGMEDMKYDMGGSAAVVGVIKALAGRKAKVNAVGVIGLVENMPGHNAQRPSDVVTSMSGQTIEVLNTDAEGRLVLADALWYTQDSYNPKWMVNLATLTGAIVVSLGDQYAGLFSNDDTLSEKLLQAGADTDEKLWRFPLSDAYDKQINSAIADMQNIGDGRGAGSITAAQFLQRFVNEVPWAHLDIAGMAWTKKDVDICPKGAVGFGVRLLDRLVADHYESK